MVRSTRPTDGGAPTGMASATRQAGPAPRDAWWRGAAAGALALTLALGTQGVVWRFLRPLLLLAAAIVTAQALAPLVARLERRLPRPLAIALPYLALILALVGLGWLGAPAIIEQSRQLVDDAPALFERIRGWLARFGPGGGDQLLERLRSGAGQVGGALVKVPLALLGSAADVVLVLAMSAYWLVASRGLERFTLSLFPPHGRARAAAVLGEMGRTMGGFVRAILLDAVIIGAVVFLGLLLIGVKFPLVLALVAALGELFPVIGPIVAAVPAVAVAAVDSPVKGLIVLGFYLVVQQVEGNILTPNIMRRQSDIPQLLVIFALVAGGAVAGILGALVAIPLAGALRVLIVEGLAPAVRAWSGAAGADVPPTEGASGDRG